ncbi:MAG: hypothetical protein KGI54_17635 [Pseudomonadota bacterium]|nr:hypothetical protein [Pseudomonadota bacterium]
MPNRIIKESICTSEEIDSLDGDIESFFYRLIVNADDFGLLDGRPKVLASKCYPLKSIDIQCILTRLEKLVSVGLIYIYTVDNKPFISILSWEKHQQIRAKKPKFPMPKSGVAINCNQLQSFDTSCARAESNPIQSNPKNAKENIKRKVLKPKTKPNPDILLPDWIPEQAWQAYLEMRVKIRKPITENAILIAIAHLDKFRQQGIKPEDVLNQSVLNSWTGLFEPSNKNGNRNKGRYDPMETIKRQQRSEENDFSTEYRVV